MIRRRKKKKTKEEEVEERRKERAWRRTVPRCLRRWFDCGTCGAPTDIPKGRGGCAGERGEARWAMCWETPFEDQDEGRAQEREEQGPHPSVGSGGGGGGGAVATATTTTTTTPGATCTSDGSART